MYRDGIITGIFNVERISPILFFIYQFSVQVCIRKILLLLPRIDGISVDPDLRLAQVGRADGDRHIR